MFKKPIRYSHIELHTTIYFFGLCSGIVSESEGGHQRNFFGVHIGLKLVFKICQINLVSWVKVREEKALGSREIFFSASGHRERERERGSIGEVWVGLCCLLRQNLGCASSGLGCTAPLERERERERGKMRVLWMMGVGVLIGCFSPHLIWCDNLSCPILIGGCNRSYPLS